MTCSSRQPRTAVAAQDAREVVAVDPLHHQVAPVGSSTMPSTSTTRGWLKAAEQPALDLEAGGVALVEQPLRGHLAPVRVGGLVDAAHRPLRHRRSEPISADELRARRWSVHGADASAAAPGTPARTLGPTLVKAWRAGSVPPTVPREPAGRSGCAVVWRSAARSAGRCVAARAAGPAAARLPGLPPDPRVPALRARGRPVAEGRARGVRLRAVLAALQAAPRARPRRPDRPGGGAAVAAGAAVGRHRGARRRRRGRRQALDDRRWEDAAAQARVALAFGAEPFLAECDGPWVRERRREVEGLRLRALEALGEAGLRLGGRELDAAEHAARTAIGLAPFRESSHRLLMEVARGLRQPRRGAAGVRRAAPAAARRYRRPARSPRHNTSKSPLTPLFQRGEFIFVRGSPLAKGGLRGISYIT